MTTRVCVALLLLLASLTAAAAEIPRLVNLQGYLRNAVVWADGAGCHLVLTWADGTQDGIKLSKARCATGAAYLKGMANAPKPAPAEAKD